LRVGHPVAVHDKLVLVCAWGQGDLAPPLAVGLALQGGGTRVPIVESACEEDFLGIAAGQGKAHVLVRASNGRVG